MSVCTKCEKFGLSFQRNYSPEEFLEGKKTSRIWIVGLNPKEKPAPLLRDLENYFQQNQIHEYFLDFKTVSEQLFRLLGQNSGAAHTDLVRCDSKSWPAKNQTDIIENCKCYFISQLRAIKPKLIICNGRAVCREIEQIILPPTDNCTAYTSNFEGNKIHVVFSGFIGRLDNFAKQRLGREIESYLNKIDLDA